MVRGLVRGKNAIAGYLLHHEREIGYSRYRAKTLEELANDMAHLAAAHPYLALACAPYFQMNGSDKGKLWTGCFNGGSIAWGIAKRVGSQNSTTLFAFWPAAGCAY